MAVEAAEHGPRQGDAIGREALVAEVLGVVVMPTVMSLTIRTAFENDGHG